MDDLRIEKIELFKVPPRWLFLKITTKSGIIGWGEPVVEGKAATVEACVNELSQYLIGRSANDIEDIWQTLYGGGFYRGGPILMSAISGIDQALWDIKGKHLGVPVYDLLGGAVRKKMKMYCWIGGDHPEVVLEQAREKVEQGYKAVKMNATGAFAWIDSLQKIKTVADNIRLLREEFGDTLDIGLDFHGRIHKGMVKRLIDELAPYNPMFIEEPVLSENKEAFDHIYPYTSIPIATGERMFSRWDFKELLHRGTVDIIQPDLSHAGGISEVRRIAAMAEAYDVALAPHCPLGPVALASCLHVDFNSINAVIQESSLGIHYNKGFDLLDYMDNPEVFDVKDGYIELLKKPGLGVEINEEKLREGQKIGHNWANPVWRNEDGSFAEW
ncbi:galactonate dehydratase [Zobellia galactanivorans]|uniref:Galactonate dehydratase n=1 Tax=Zobellia galactanivorans (strain DSM 12802 / CCUG 47099 / CIP 106680 / NCIMB 13871 / Dsij) TaxID=63186 RepID=G0L9L1_ZOBGA|nr:galactonate dehydratase [Zobellia galactanivorans]MBU3026904.1 galactonate dehydratase [Zobellia galactanivorans]CAZ94660.1 Galactonate dehydratase [Zobellia galactanivorans]